MSQKLFNSTPFPVFIKELGKSLAPFESIIVKDAEVAKRLATGVLSADLSKLKTIYKDAKEDLDSLIAAWHDEHGQPPAPVKPTPAPAPPAPAVKREDEVRGSTPVEQSTKPDAETR